MNDTEIGEYIGGLLEMSITEFLSLILSTIISFFQQVWDIVVVNFFRKSSFLGASPLVMGIIIALIIGMRIAFSHILDRQD